MFVYVSLVSIALGVIIPFLVFEKLRTSVTLDYCKSLFAALAVIAFTLGLLAVSEGVFSVNRLNSSTWDVLGGFYEDLAKALLFGTMLSTAPYLSKSNAPFLIGLIIGLLEGISIFVHTLETSNPSLLTLSYTLVTRPITQGIMTYIVATSVISKRYLILLIFTLLHSAHNFLVQIDFLRIGEYTASALALDTVRLSISIIYQICVICLFVFIKKESFLNYKIFTKNVSE